MKLEVIHTPAPPPPPPKTEVILTLTPDEAWHLKWVLASRSKPREEQDLMSYTDLSATTAKAAADSSGELWRMLDDLLDNVPQPAPRIEK